MTEWNIQSRGRACGACEKTFADKEAYHTLLFEQRAELLRQDICQACWEKQYSEGSRDRKGFLSYWQGVYNAPAQKQEDAIQKETAETLLRKLIELNDPQYVPAGYILAVMLERKRLLKVKEQLVRDGQRVFIYEHPKTGEVFTIIDPNLQLDQLEQVQHDVGRLLEHGLTSPGEEPSHPSGEISTGPAEDESPAEPCEPASEPEPEPAEKPDTAPPGA
jgi:hypothetical protein